MRKGLNTAQIPHQCTVTPSAGSGSKISIDFLKTKWDTCNNWCKCEQDAIFQRPRSAQSRTVRVSWLVTSCQGLSLTPSERLSLQKKRILKVMSRSRLNLMMLRTTTFQG